MNTKVKGDIAVAHAIATFTEMGYEVLLPIGDKKPYDLVVDDGTTLKKVQVKYAGLNVNGKAMAQLRTVGGNQSFQTIKKYSDEDFDILFVWTYSGHAYVFPWNQITARNAITVDIDKYAQFMIY